MEYRLDGVKQIQINPRAGVTFPTTLPSILRADPDIVFIGEVRDAETARIAADASITGHLVLSTLHATRAAAAPMRLIEMGVEPYLVASALTSGRRATTRAQALRQVRGAGRPPDLDLLAPARATDEILDEGATVRDAVGCPPAEHRLPRRLPIFEIMPVTEDISRLIVDRVAERRHRTGRGRRGHGDDAHRGAAPRAEGRPQHRRDGARRLVALRNYRARRTPSMCTKRGCARP